MSQLKKVSPEDTRKSKRTRKSVNYSEQIKDGHEDSDSDFEIDKKTVDKPLKLQKKTLSMRKSHSDEEDDIPLIKTLSKKKQKVVLEKRKPSGGLSQTNGYGARPNLSEEESSDSECEERVFRKITNDILKEQDSVNPIFSMNDTQVKIGTDGNSGDSYLEIDSQHKAEEATESHLSSVKAIESSEIKVEEEVHGFDNNETNDFCNDKKQVTQKALRKRKSDTKLNNGKTKKQKVEVLLDDCKFNVTDKKRNRSELSKKGKQKNKKDKQSDMVKELQVGLDMQVDVGFSSDDESDSWEEVRGKLLFILSP
jgi:hypothetical protein